MLANLATRLERVAGRLRAVRDRLEEDDGSNKLYIFNHKSMTQAIEAAEAFSFETERAWDAYERGEPYNAKTTKAALSGRQPQSQPPKKKAARAKKSVRSKKKRKS